MVQVDSGVDPHYPPPHRSRNISPCSARAIPGPGGSPEPRCEGFLAIRGDEAAPNSTGGRTRCHDPIAGSPTDKRWSSEGRPSLTRCSYRRSRLGITRSTIYWRRATSCPPSAHPPLKAGIAKKPQKRCGHVLLRPAFHERPRLVFFDRIDVPADLCRHHGSGRSHGLDDRVWEPFASRAQHGDIEEGGGGSKGGATARGRWTRDRLCPAPWQVPPGPCRQGPSPNRREMYVRMGDTNDPSRSQKKGMILDQN